MFNALIDHGSHTVLIDDKCADLLSLKRQKLIEPMAIEMAMPGEGPKKVIMLYEWVKLHLYDPCGYWYLKTVHAVIAPSLCASVTLGTPFTPFSGNYLYHTGHPF